MIYKDILGKKVHRRFVTLAVMGYDLIVDGIFETYDEAVGSVMSGLWEFAESYKDDGDQFVIGLPKASELDASEMIEVYFKKKSWSHGEHEQRYILNFDENVKTEKGDTHE